MTWEACSNSGASPAGTAGGRHGADLLRFRAPAGLMLADQPCCDTVPNTFFLQKCCSSRKCCALLHSVQSLKPVHTLDGWLSRRNNHRVVSRSSKTAPSRQQSLMLHRLTLCASYTYQSLCHWCTCRHLDWHLRGSPWILQALAHQQRLRQVPQAGMLTKGTASRS